MWRTSSAALLTLEKRGRNWEKREGEAGAKEEGKKGRKRGGNESGWRGDGSFSLRFPPSDETHAPSNPARH
jgi:hypothetical protein